MRDISDSKISYYGRNRRVFLSNPRYKSDSRVKTKPTFNQLIKQTQNQFIEKWGPFMEVNDPALYESMTGKKARKPVVDESKPKNENIEIKVSTPSDDLDNYQKQRDAERKAELEKARAKQKEQVKFNYVKPKINWSIYGGWVNAYEPVNKGRLGSTQEWRKEKKYPVYY